MLSLFHWLDQHPAAYWTGALAATTAFLVHSLRPQAGAPVRAASVWFAVQVAVLLLAWRWPQLLAPYEFNPDESQFIAGALTLRHDPVFWRSVDGMTAGPLIFYALVPFSRLGLPLDYFTARLAALIGFGLAAGALHRLVARHHGERAAFLGLLPPVVFLAQATDQNFIHYSSEIVPVVLLAFSGLLLLAPGPAGRGRLLAGGLIAGLTPWAKLQSAPIAAVLVLAALWRERHHAACWSRAATLCGSTLIPAFAVGVGLAWYGLGEEFYRSYLVQNLFYTDPGQHVANVESNFRRWEPSQVRFAVTAGASLAGTLLAFALRPRAAATSPLIRLGLVAGGVGLVCVLLPGRDFLHYLLLLLPSLAWLGGGAWGVLAGAGTSPEPWLRRAAVALPLGVALVLVAARCLRPDPPMLGQLASWWRQPYSDLDRLVRWLARPERGLAIWGWRMDLYVAGRCWHATRSAYNYWELKDSPQRDHFRARYLADLQRNRPVVFVDAVGPHSQFLHDRHHEAHEIFPELAAVVRRDYLLLADLGHARVYARRDTVVARQVTQAQVWATLSAGRRENPAARFPREDLNAIPHPKHVIAGRYAVELQPVREATWTLTGLEREFHFEYGYVPPADRQKEGNGTTFEIEVLEPDGRRHPLSVFHIDPANQPGDRGFQQRLLTLPPAAPGSRLVVRTLPGPFDNDAWDWAYLAEVSFQRSHQPSFRLFPGFNRPPDYLLAPAPPVPLPEDADTATPAQPRAFLFFLTGDERTLSFDYGLGEPEEIAELTLTVDLLAPEREPQVLFQRHLQPARQTRDRGDQRAELVLPELSPGMELRFRVEIDPTTLVVPAPLRNLRLD